MRELALALLNDEHGINEKAWLMLHDTMEKAGDCEDIFPAIRTQDGRWFLRADFAGIVPEDCPF